MRTPYRLALLLSLAACNGTDVGNPPRGGITDFETSACKSASSDKGIDPPPVWQPDPDVYAGLTCVLWETEGDLLRVRLTNHQAGCHKNEGWKPFAEQRHSNVDLVLDNPECIAAGCGNCIYDLAFDVRLGSAQRDASDLSLRVIGDDCNGGDRPVYHTLELTGAERWAGARCRYSFTAGFGGLSGDPIGNLGGSCGTLPSAMAVPCHRGVCTPNAVNHSVCLNACSSDADCKATDVLACVDGACQLREQP